MDNLDFQPAAVTFQAVGTLLLALMLLQLARTFQRRYTMQWAAAWAALFLAVLAKRVSMHFGSPLLGAAYLAGQWTFLALLYAGCRDLVDRPVRTRPLAFLAPIAAALALLIAFAAADFSQLFILEAAVMFVGTFLSFRVVLPVRRPTTGWRTFRIAVLLLAVIYLDHLPLYVIHNVGINIRFLPYSALTDLMAQLFLGFSMILIATEEAQRELTDANAALQVARDQLELKVKVDPLTRALSRHAFPALPRDLTGVVVMIDVDHLKQINDNEGHRAGDEALLSIADAIRSRFRTDDYLFRWGGDEFLIVVPGSTLDQVKARIEPIAGGVIANSGRTIQFSWGAAHFNREQTLEEAMRLADAAMYDARSTRRKPQVA